MITSAVKQVPAASGQSSGCTTLPEVELKLCSKKIFPCSLARLFVCGTVKSADNLKKASAAVTIQNDAGEVSYGPTERVAANSYRSHQLYQYNIINTKLQEW